MSSAFLLSFYLFLSVQVLLEPESEEDMLENEHEDFQEDDLFVANDVLLRRRHAPLSKLLSLSVDYVDTFGNIYTIVFIILSSIFMSLPNIFFENKIICLLVKERFISISSVNSFVVFHHTPPPFF